MFKVEFLSFAKFESFFFFFYGSYHIPVVFSLTLDNELPRLPPHLALSLTLFVHLILVCRGWPLAG